MSQAPDGFVLSVGAEDKLKTVLRGGLNNPDWRGGPILADPAFIPCRVSKDGGAAGDATTQCSWTYRVMTMDGQVLMDEAMPLKPRPALGPMLAQEEIETTDRKYGSRFYDGDGAMQLWDAGEVEDVLVCPEP